jgi:hypothetical protein
MSNFVASIAEKIEFINSVVPLFIDNNIKQADFISISDCHSDDTFFEFYCIKDSVKLIHFILNEDEITVDVSSIPEVFIWHNTELHRNPKSIREIIGSLFKGYILLNRYEQENVEIILFDNLRKLVFSKLYKPLNFFAAFKGNRLKCSNLYLPNNFQ